MQGLIDGAVVMEIRLHDERIDLLRAANATFSLIGRTEDTTGISYVDIDFDQMAREAVRHLVDRGHEHIAFLNHSQSAYDAGYGPSVRAQGVEALLAQLEDQQAPRLQRVLPCRLVVRGSSGPHRRRAHGGDDHAQH